MLDDTTGKLVAWDGQKAGTAVGVLALELDGSENLLTYWKSGTFATESLAWPKSVDAIKQAMSLPEAPSVTPLYCIKKAAKRPLSYLTSGGHHLWDCLPPASCWVIPSRKLNLTHSS